MPAADIKKVLNEIGSDIIWMNEHCVSKGPAKYYFVMKYPLGWPVSATQQQ